MALNAQRFGQEHKMMTNFSDAYINSPLVRNLLEGIPEAERDLFLQHLRKNVSMYDGLVGGANGSPFVFDLLRASEDPTPEQETRRPPRRR